MLFEDSGTGMRLSWQVLIPTLVLISGFFVVVSGLVFKSHLSKPRTGVRGLIGEIGVVREPLIPEGKVFVHGELWRAISKDPVQTGDRVRVVNVVNLVLEVEPFERSI
jgi:membrane-bound serine protease (ClpP class)